MESKIRTAQRAIDRLFSVIHPDDEIFLMTFAMRTSLIAGFTSDRTKLNRALLTGVNLSGGTSLYDSLYQALQEVKRGRYQKKAVLLVTDGEDTTSVTRFDKALQYIQNPRCWSTASGSGARRYSTWERSPDRAGTEPHHRRYEGAGPVRRSERRQGMGDLPRPHSARNWTRCSTRLLRNSAANTALATTRPIR